jgi:WD40 repeat protein
LAPPPALWRREGVKWRLEVARSPAPIVLAEAAFNVGFRCSVDAKGTRLATYASDTLVLWDLATLEPIAKRPNSSFGVTTFTPHGLAVPVRDSTDIVTGSKGEFSVPSGGGGYAFYSGSGDSIAGFLLRGDRADIIDLQERRITSTLALSSSFGPPHVALSDDGSRLLVVPPAQPATLVSWALPRSSSVELPKKDPVGSVSFAADGSRFATGSGPVDGTVEIDVWTREGSLVRSFGAQTLRRIAPVLSSDGSRLALYSASRAAVWDVASSASVLDIDCPICGGMALSGNGSLALASEDYRVSLWDVAGRRRRWTLDRAVWAAAGTDLSDDGALAALADDVSLRIVATDSGATRVKLPLVGHASSSVAFSHDAKRVAVASLKGVFVWRVDGAPLWSTALVKARSPLLRWSIDDSKLIVGDDESTILDSGSGELLAHVDPEARSPQLHSFVSPDLRYLVKKGRVTWQLQPLPKPEDGPPSRVLASVLEQAGLELRGAELAPADQLRNASASKP